MSPTSSGRPTKDEAKAAKEEEEPEEETKSGIKVSWVGFGERKISAEDWKSLDIAEETTTWTYKNRFSATVSQEAAEYLLAEATGFRLTSDVRKEKLAAKGIDLSKETEGE